MSDDTPIDLGKVRRDNELGGLTERFRAAMTSGDSAAFDEAMKSVHALVRDSVERMGGTARELTDEEKRVLAVLSSAMRRLSKLLPGLPTLLQVSVARHLCAVSSLMLEIENGPMPAAIRDFGDIGALPYHPIARLP